MAATAMLWRHLFPAEHLWEPGLLPEVELWPDALGERPTSAAFPWLDPPGLYCWWPDAAAQSETVGLPAPPRSPSPEIVAQVHDKGFALEGALALDLMPPALKNLIQSYSPAELAKPGPWLRELERRLADWPDWVGGDFTLKPRLGSSGRGRVAGRSDDLESPRLRAGLARLSDRGGAILEPWLQRRGDFSVVLHVAAPDPPGEATDPNPAPLTILGSLEIFATPAGLYLGHFGEIDSRGRVFGAGPHEETLREVAAAMADRARQQGFWGPCGLDSLLFRGPGQRDSPSNIQLRPVVEFNARFTVGTIVVGLIRRALPRVRDSLDLGPGERLAFFFALDTPATGQSWEALAEGLPGAKLLLPLAAPNATSRPALLFTNAMPELRACLEPGTHPAP